MRKDKEPWKDKAKNRTHKMKKRQKEWEERGTDDWYMNMLPRVFLATKAGRCYSSCVSCILSTQ